MLTIVYLATAELRSRKRDSFEFCMMYSLSDSASAEALFRRWYGSQLVFCFPTNLASGQARTSSPLAETETGNAPGELQEAQTGGIYSRPCCCGPRHAVNPSIRLTGENGTHGMIFNLFFTENIKSWTDFPCFSTAFR